MLKKAHNQPDPEKPPMAPQESHPLIAFPPGSRSALFLRREKRFRVEVETEQGRMWIHTNNSGSMMGLLIPGAEVFISPAQRPGRKLPYTLELARVHGFWVGVNTSVPNRLLYAAWKAGLLPEAAGYESFRKEAVTGDSRLDALLEGSCGRLWVEAKNVTLVEDEVAAFPDAVTVRGQKHIRELRTLAGNGDRVACFYLIQRPDARCFAPADFIDPDFARLFWQGHDSGVEAWPYQALVSPRGISLGPRLPLAPREYNGS
jgi:sugar fermentation stimulation protein A